jgi:hypothetical protein
MSTIVIAMRIKPFLIFIGGLRKKDITGSIAILARGGAVVLRRG